MIEFENTPKAEQETHISIDYASKIVGVYSCHRATCSRLLRTLTATPVNSTIGGKLAALDYYIPFSDKENLKKLIKLNMFLGKIS